jgi:asparagine synthase (glutamine-hydrolysing)
VFASTTALSQGTRSPDRIRRLSAFAAAVPRTRRSPPAEGGAVRAMVSRLRSRGAEHAILERRGAVLASAYHPWEASLRASAAGGVAVAGDLALVADASLYYRDDLRRAMAASGTRIGEADRADRLVLAAFRTWGEACVARLEGDFAWLVHDAAADVAVAARDFSGRRPLFYAVLPDILLVASSVGAVLAHPACPQELDPAGIAAAAAGLFGDPGGSAHRAVRALPPGHTLVLRDGRVTIHRHWSAPVVETRRTIRGVTLDEGAEELRSLLLRAAAERTDGETTAVWMSGGWDSPAVFGAAHAASRGSSRIRPVSISYPPGDPGREDEHIARIAEHTGTDVHWLDIGKIPLFDDPAARAAARDQPFGHIYETWNRALARGSRSVGARVAFDGVGGDQLFQVSFVVLAELLRHARFLAMREEWRAKRLRGRRFFLQWAVLPNLPEAARHALGRILGGEVVRTYLERPVPPWIRTDALERHGVLERERAGMPPAGRSAPVAYEMRWYLEHPFAGKILSTVSDLALQEGIELRSPLYDGRVVRFAVSRPWNERSWRGETKRTLRRAAAAWLPDDVLAPRTSRTGTTSGYLERSFRHGNLDFVRTYLADPLLAQLGMVDASVLRAEWARYRRSGGENRAVALLFTLQTEMWLRTHAGFESGAAGGERRRGT